MNTTILSRDGKMIGSQSLMHQYHLINKKLGTKLTPTHEMPLVLRYHLLMRNLAPFLLIMHVEHPPEVHNRT
jgi:hypothetical protein